MAKLFGGIEAGGTKFVCGIGNSDGKLLDQIRFPTTTPDKTIEQALVFFRKHEALEGLGIASFGPLDLDKTSPEYGHITTTPKPGWSGTDLAGRVSRALKVPVAFDTDVNGAALGEHCWGAAQGLDTFIYMTIGTGIGGGGMLDGSLLHGALHPEMGHMRIPHDRTTDPFEGVCPYHGDCLEGLAAGPAIEARWGTRGETLGADHPAWQLEADYLGLALANLVLTLSPRRIILGGGVMLVRGMFGMVRSALQKALNGYVQHPAFLEDIETTVVPPALGNDAGVLGAIALAIQD
jgi:fructokinase